MISTRKPFFSACSASLREESRDRGSSDSRFREPEDERETRGTGDADIAEDGHLHGGRGGGFVPAEAAATDDDAVRERPREDSDKQERKE